jgi:Flp pilus assembly protein CpaB
MTRTPTQPSAPPVGGTSLLIVGLALGVLSAVLTYWYLTQAVASNEGDTFTVYRMTASLKPPRSLQERDVEVVPMPRKYEKSFEGFVRGSDELKARVNSPLRRTASQGDFLMYAHFAETGDSATMVEPGDTGRLISLPVNPRSLPASLQRGAYVDIAAPFNVGGTLPEIKLVVQRVKVIRMGSDVNQADDGETGPARRSGRVDALTIEVEPDVALELATVKMMVAGDFEVQQRATNNTKVDFAGLNPDLKERIRSGTVGPGKKR